MSTHAIKIGVHVQGFIQNFHQGGANVTLANVSGGEDFGGTLVLI